jgi:hypothetical protein
MDSTPPKQNMKIETTKDKKRRSYIWANQAELDLLGYCKEEYFDFPFTSVSSQIGYKTI